MVSPHAAILLSYLIERQLHARIPRGFAGSHFEIRKLPIVPVTGISRQVQVVGLHGHWLKPVQSQISTETRQLLETMQTSLAYKMGKKFLLSKNGIAHALPKVSDGTPAWTPSACPGVPVNRF